MFGRFLEFSVASDDIPASLDFYRRLGFSEASVGAAWDYPYAVVTDGRICIGLHQVADMPASLTFVKADLRRAILALEQLGLALELNRLGESVFNEIGFLEPCGLLLRMIEARSFSPSERAPTNLSACGYFEEIALPATDIDAAKAFWESAGFVGMDEMHARLPHVSCTSDFIDIGLYERKQIHTALLRFDADDLPARVARLAAAGIEAQRSAPSALRGQHGALFVAPEGTRLWLSSSEDR